MKLAVAMCSYNGANYLDEQLRSIATQSRLPDAMLVCDDGSTDQTLPLLKRFASTVNFPVRIIENPRRLGSTANFSQAMAMCDGDVIVLADQDDVWHENRLACIESAFAAAPETGGIFSNAELIDANGRPLHASLWHSVGFARDAQIAVRDNKAFDLLLKANFITGATLAFRAQLRDLLLPVPAGWVHDYWIASLLAASTRVDFIDRALIKYRCHEAQQLGVRRSMADGWKQFRKRDRTAYLAAEARWNEVAQRLKHGGIPAGSAVLAKCRAIAAHMHRRGSLPRQRLQRIPEIFRETLNGNYFRYSLGASSILSDLLGD